MITFETDCFSYGPTAGGGRIYSKATGAPEGTRKRSDASRKRRSLKQIYRKSVYIKKEYSFKDWLRSLEQKPAKRARLRTHQIAALSTLRS